MNRKSVAIIVAVALIVAGITYVSFLLDSDDDQGDSLEIRDFLVEGDWVEYDYDGVTLKYVVEGVEYIGGYLTTVLGDVSTTAPYEFFFTVIDPETDNVQFLRTETVDTFLGEIECGVYGASDMFGDYEYYLEPSTGLVLITEFTSIYGATSTDVMTGTSLFDPIEVTDTGISLSQPREGSSYTIEQSFWYSMDGGDFYSGIGSDTVEVESVNGDGTLNLVQSADPVTIEEYMSALLMGEVEKSAMTLEGTRTVSTQWGLMECEIYSMELVPTNQFGSGQTNLLVDPDTDVVLMTWSDYTDITYDGDVWDEGHIESVLVDCNLIQTVG